MKRGFRDIILCILTVTIGVLSTVMSITLLLKYIIYPKISWIFDIAFAIVIIYVLRYQLFRKDTMFSDNDDFDDITNNKIYR